MERHIKALKEVEQIYRMSQKWQRNMPDEKRPNFSRMADRAFRRALSLPVREDRMEVDVRAGKMHHEHDERTARLIERTLKTGAYGPDALSSYREGRVLRERRTYIPERPAPRPTDLFARHIVRHPGQEIEYPVGHMQGAGFVPAMHNSELFHKELKPVAGQSLPRDLPMTDALPGTHT